jgi:hypothetical protein
VTEGDRRHLQWDAAAGPFPETAVALLRRSPTRRDRHRERAPVQGARARNRDLTEALEQQTATSDILRVISQSQTAVQPVFDTIVRSVLSLCGAASAASISSTRTTFDARGHGGHVPGSDGCIQPGYPRKMEATRSPDAPRSSAVS